MVALCESWRIATTPREKNRVLSELWLLLNTALTYYIRFHGRSQGHVDPEDARDIASEKAMVFLRGLESDSPASPPPDAERLCAYLSTLARNGLVDVLRKQGRTRDLERKLGDSMETRVTAENAEFNVQRAQFVEAICACMNELTPRARSAWFLRAFLDLPSRKIAAHPDVQMTATGVDMLLSRTRKTLSACLNAKGLNAEDAPTGTFLALWDMLRRGAAHEERSADDS